MFPAIISPSQTSSKKTEENKGIELEVKPKITPINEPKPAAPSLESLGVTGFVEPKLRVAQYDNPNSDSEEEYHATESERKKLEDPWNKDLNKRLEHINKIHETRNI